MPKDNPTIKFANVNDLLFDPHNPRLPSTLREKYDEAEVIEWMLLNENVIELMGSIGEKGYFPAEPLLVVPSKKRSGKYEVVEGNRRLAALKILNNPSLAKVKKDSVKQYVAEAKQKPTELPVIIFKEREEILVYLGYRHITGTRRWSSLAKARYLEDLKETLKIKKVDDQYKALAKLIGSKPVYVRSLLLGLDIYKIIEDNDFFGIEGLDEEKVEFGVLYTALSRTNIASFIGVDLKSSTPVKGIIKKNLKELVTWMFEILEDGYSRVGESRDLADLDKVVAHSSALKVFRSGRPLSEAALLTDKPTEIFLKSVNRALDNLKSARDQSHNLAHKDFSAISSSLELLDEVSRLSSELKLLVSVKK